MTFRQAVLFKAMESLSHHARPIDVHTAGSNSSGPDATVISQ